MIWEVPKIWSEGDVWIIGGGPSVVEQFKVPNDIVQAVKIGEQPISTYSSFMTDIRDKHIIGVNIAYLLGSWVDFVFFGDHGFFIKHKQGLYNYGGLKVTCVDSAKNEDWVKFLTKDKAVPFGISGNPKAVSWNVNSGAAAINLAVHTGAKRIFLLGFDMDLAEDNSQHWHNVYRNNTKDPAQPKSMRKNLPFTRHLRGFQKIAADAKKLGVEIINVSPKSRITEFTKLTLHEALKL